MSDAPTQRFDLTPEPGQPSGAAPAPEPRRNRGLLIALIIVAALLVAAIVAAVVLFLVPRGTPVAAATTSPTPSISSPTPSPTVSSPSPTPSASAKTGGSSSGGSSSGGSGGSGSGSGSGGGSQPTGGAFTSIQPKSPVTCSKGGPFTQPVRPDIDVSWSTVRTQSVWIVAGTSDAADSKFMQLPPSGSSQDFSSPITYQCSQTSEVFTLTLVGDDGKHVSKQFTINNIGDTF